MEPYLGHIPDTDIAAQLGCSVPSVLNKRRALGIPPLDMKKMGRGNKIWHPVIAKFLFDSFTDAQIAETFEIDEDVVRWRRQFHNEILSEDLMTEAE